MLTIFFTLFKFKQMLDQIAELVKQYGQQTVIDNPEVPNDLNNQLMAEAASTISGGLQNILSGGGLQGLLGLFGGNQNQNQSRGGILSNPIVAMMVGHLANKLVQNLKLSPAVANNVSNNIIPNVINSLTQRTVSNAPQDSGFDLNGLIASLTGGQRGSQAGGIDFQNLLHQFTQDGSATIDQNKIDQLTEQAQQQQQRNGGLADLIQGFFK